jgi:DNA-binding FadR family transcriptional regulator
VTTLPDLGREGPPQERGSAVDAVVDEIRSMIRDRGLTVGDALPSEIELAVMFGASRNTVREAIRTLKAYGVVESRQKVGAVLTDRRQAAVMDLFSFAIDVSAETFRDIQGFRRLIEMNLGDALIGGAAQGFVADAAEINDRLALETDPIEASRLDFRFHQTLVEAVGNRTLCEIYGILEPVIRKVMELGKTQRVAIHHAADEHRGILDALREGDRLAFAYRMHRHLDAGLQYIPAAKGGPGPAGD